MFIVIYVQNLCTLNDFNKIIYIYILFYFQYFYLSPLFRHNCIFFSKTNLFYAVNLGLNLFKIYLKLLSFFALFLM